MLGFSSIAFLPARAVTSRPYLIPGLVHAASRADLVGDNRRALQRELCPRTHAAIFLPQPTSPMSPPSKLSFAPLIAVAAVDRGQAGDFTYRRR